MRLTRNLSKETKEKISNSLKNRVRDEKKEKIRREKIRKSMLKYWASIPKNNGDTNNNE